MEPHRGLATTDGANGGDLAVTGSEAPADAPLEAPATGEEMLALAEEPTEAGAEAAEEAAGETLVPEDGPARAVGVAVEVGPLGETQAAVIAPEPPADGAGAG